MELDGRPVRDFAKPNIQILALPCLEEEHVVAVVELGQLVQFVQLCLGVEFCIFSAVGEHCCNVV